MGVSLVLLPRFEPGERVLQSKGWIWAAVGKSLPAYRISISIPIIVESGLYVTPHRLVFVTLLFRLVLFQASVWFDGDEASAGHETVRSAACGRDRLFGPYLEIITENTARHWWRSHQVRLRLYMTKPELLEGSIQEALGTAGKHSQPPDAPSDT